jgi:asparagine synthase (glutamine-hydrolysing)
LRLELEAEGYWFRSNTDSEVVLNAFAAWGNRAISRFNGMFALAIWDRKQRQLTLTRDRYGIKPLYYAHYHNTFSFASEQKGILADNNKRIDVDLHALVEYFTFQNFITSRTLVKGIQILPAGHFMTVNLSHGKFQTQLERYWDYHFCEPTHASTHVEYREELDRLFQQAVNRHLISDVEIGSYLSGGMDSGAIVAIAGRSLPYLKTFTCGFDLSSASGIELAFDERVKAEAMSAKFRTEHYEMVIKAGDMERAMPRLVYHIEEPRVGQSYPNFYAAQLASKFVKVVLSGAGGDELFGGYPWRYYRAMLNEHFEDYIDKYFGFWQRLVEGHQIPKLFSPVWNEVKEVRPRDLFRDVFLSHKNELKNPTDYINHSLYFEAKTFLHGLLVIEDKLSMAHGLETRTPFLDNDLVDFAMNIPVELKLNNLNSAVRINENEPGPKQKLHFQKTNDGKQILRDVMARYIPQSIIDAEKQGFSAPDASWFKGDSIDYVRRLLIDGRPRITQFLDHKAIKELLQEHLDGKQNRRLFIWSLLNIEQWLALHNI